MAKKSENENKKKNVHEISVKIEGKEWTDAVDKAFKEKQKTAKVDGFRKGKVPRRIYEKKFGVQSLYMDAIENITHDAYFKVLEESKLVPVVKPEMDIKDFSDKGVELVLVLSLRK